MPADAYASAARRLPGGRAPAKRRSRRGFAGGAAAQARAVPRAPVGLGSRFSLRPQRPPARP
eukprot:7957540-Lingulodinium_polyedra.AAC.1